MTIFFLLLGFIVIVAIVIGINSLSNYLFYKSLIKNGGLGILNQKITALELKLANKPVGNEEEWEYLELLKYYKQKCDHYNKKPQKNLVVSE